MLFICKPEGFAPVMCCSSFQLKSCILKLTVKLSIIVLAHLNKERKVIIWEDAGNNTSGNNNQTKSLNKIH